MKQVRLFAPPSRQLHGSNKTGDGAHIGGNHLLLLLNRCVGLSGRRLPGVWARGHCHVAVRSLSTLALIVISSECRRGNDHDALPAKAAGSGAGVAAPSTIRKSDDSVEFQLVVASGVRRGDSLPIELRIRNLASRPIQLMIGGDPPAIDFEVRDSRTGQVVWRALRGFVSLPIGSHTLAREAIMRVQRMCPMRSTDGTPIALGTYDVVANVPFPTNANGVRVGPARVEVRE